MLSTIAVIYNLVTHAEYGYQTFDHAIVVVKSLFLGIGLFLETRVFLL